MIPLSTRMRPLNLESFFGQRHFVYPGSLFYKAVKNKTFESTIFYGPSGTGKTSLARIIAKEMECGFYELNASAAGTKELKDILSDLQPSLLSLNKMPPYVYVDEIHRWNRLQQDSLLQAIEEGRIRLIGSTTENPYFSINNAILSRVSAVYEFKPLEGEDILRILQLALTDTDRGLGKQHFRAAEETLLLIAECSGGDARVALDTLGFIAENTDAGAEITPELVGEAMQRPMGFYHKTEDKYNLLSALQKSVRGSDPDAAIHYLARLIDGGADVNTIGRRLLVMASEDVGMAYPSAITIVTSCVQAAQMTGFPEARIMLAQAVILLASCPKSNSSLMAIERALADVKSKRIDDVPSHLKDSHYSGASERGLGRGYQYPHDYGGYVTQQYLPDSLEKEKIVYYTPTENGKEGAFKRFLESLKKKTI